MSRADRSRSPAARSRTPTFITTCSRLRIFSGKRASASAGSGAGDPEYEAAYTNALVGWFSLMNMGEALQSNRVFRKALEDAAEPPGLLAILFGDHSVTLSTRSDYGERGEARLLNGVTLDTYRVPMSLSFGSAKAMDFEVTAARIRAPLGLCGGVVSLDGASPIEGGSAGVREAACLQEGRGCSMTGWGCSARLRRMARTGLGVEAHQLQRQGDEFVDARGDLSEHEALEDGEIVPEDRLVARAGP